MRKNLQIDLLARDPSAEPWALDISNLRRGIDNYHVDIRISPRFNGAVRKLSSSLLEQETSASPRTINNSREIEALKSAYLDIKTVLFSRTKTDLGKDEVQLLEFAIVRHVLETVRQQLDELISTLKAKAAEYRERGSSEALSANQHLVHLQRNYDAILFQVNRQIFTQMQRLESRQHLRVLREQYLPGEGNDIVAALHNPMLFTSNISAAPFQVEQYRLWDCRGEDGEEAAFNQVNREIELVLGKELPEWSILPLRQEQNHSPEIHDALGGLLETQRFMGAASHQKAVIREDFCWLDNPLAVGEIFAVERYPVLLANVRQELGFGAWWRLRKQTRRMHRILARLARRLQKLGLYRQLIAAQQVSRVWNAMLAERLDAKVLCQYFCGRITIRQLQERSRKSFPDALTAQIEKNAEEVEKQSSSASPLNTMRIIEDISRFRLHLKYYRIAHRAFNRLKILKLNEEIQLSKEAGTLYSVFAANEREESERRIVHHAILKADVRGSTLVTQQLLDRELNPASYFSMRFFNPVNEILNTYCASKVFVEGDAVILSFLEYEAEPQQWFAVARACGLARTMLRIVKASNHYAKQIDLPPLELGIGICYSPEPPHFLYDEEKPIMISSAIGHADRLSSCSWKLRGLADASPFNVAVYQLDESDPGRGEKGQHLIRYNVNGILLDDTAFARLKTETSLRQLSVMINREQTTFYTGKYPDTDGKIRELLVREGRVGLWRGDSVAPGMGEGIFYEVVSNPQILSEVLGQK